MTNLDRRSFLAAAALAPAAVALPSASRAARRRYRSAGVPIAIASGNGLAAVTKAMEDMKAGADPADAIVNGVTIVEDDPNDMSVGYGGLPNADGVVQLDASVLHGPSHKAGAVGAIEDIRNPAKVALTVLRRTDHVMLVGEGAKQFAIDHGFEEQNLLTRRAREAWLRWKENLNPDDDWLNADQHVGTDPRQAMAESIGVPFTYGTINCSAVDVNGDIASCTTTSGLSYKIPGRVGDSPIVGAGMFADNAVGAAGATGRGESLIQSCGAFQIVRHMEDGIEPTEACLQVLKWIADHTRRPSLLNDRGEPNFNAVVYAVRKDGAYGAACMRGSRTFAVHDGTEGRIENSTSLF